MNRSKAIETRIAGDIEKKSGLLRNIETTASLKLPQMQFFSRRLISVRDLAINYGDRDICSGVSFNIEQGKVTALTGRNGCGKTSIIRLLCGEDVPHTGEVVMNHQLRISRIEQETSDLRGTLADYASDRCFEQSLFLAILRKLGFAREQFATDISGFSDGQKKKVLIAASLCTPAHIYIWDEPLNYLDVVSRKQLEELIISCRPTMLIVEHDETFRRRIGAQEIILTAATFTSV
jgi:lincosamide and streptogramin A transport system ATP-binding/permease protein